VNFVGPPVERGERQRRRRRSDVNVRGRHQFGGRDRRHCCNWLLQGGHAGDALPKLLAETGRRGIGGGDGGTWEGQRSSKY
jgi:hypothetical protein